MVILWSAAFPAVTSAMIHSHAACWFQRLDIRCPQITLHCSGTAVKHSNVITLNSTTQDVQRALLWMGGNDVCLSHVNDFHHTWWATLKRKRTKINLFILKSDGFTHKCPSIQIISMFTIKEAPGKSQSFKVHVRLVNRRRSTFSTSSYRHAGLMSNKKQKSLRNHLKVCGSVASTAS